MKQVSRKMVMFAFKALKGLQLRSRWSVAQEKILAKLHAGFLVAVAIKKPSLGIRLWFHSKALSGTGLASETENDFLQLAYEHTLPDGTIQNLLAKIPVRWLDPMQMLHIVKHLIAKGQASVHGEMMDKESGTNAINTSLVRRLLHPKLFDDILAFLPERDHLSLRGLYSEYRTV